jgi:hypothetical protein
MAWILFGRKPQVTRGAALLAAVVLAAGCGGGDNPSSTAGDAEGPSEVAQSVLTQEQAEQALLTLENLGDEFRVDAEEGDSGTSDMGCLSALGDVENLDAAVEAEASYEYADEMGTPAIYNSVASFEQTSEVTAAFDEVKVALESCTQVDVTDDDGLRMQLDVDVDDQKTTTDVDDQVNILASGSASADGLELPFSFGVSLARVDNNTTMVGVVGVGEFGLELLDGYTEIAVDRVVAVAGGQDPPEAVAAPLGYADEPIEEPQPQEENFEALPLDGGSYTWASGVQLRLSVERVEPWGSTSDFCGDGSCGVANPDDTRFVFKYEVTVPEDFPAPFESYSCPGQLQVATGNDDEALSGVLGDYYRDLGGTVFPGSTKFGIEEYYIEKAYVGEEFYIESTCGDVDYTGETAYFVGKIESSP